MILFQPQYKAVQKWQEVLRGTNPALKKKAVVAIGRQLMVDLWRLQTGRISAPELNLIMVEGQARSEVTRRLRVLTWGSAPNPGSGGSAKSGALNQRRPD